MPALLNRDVTSLARGFSTKRVTRPSGPSRRPRRPMGSQPARGRSAPLPPSLDDASGRVGIRPLARGGEARAVGGGGKFPIVYGLPDSLDLGEIRVFNIPIYIRTTGAVRSPLCGSPLHSSARRKQRAAEPRH